MGSLKECEVVLSSSSSSRWKREDCTDPKHDSLFSYWKVLIGPSDWEDHSLRKEGAERYRVHNLPNCSSCSGVYELGIVKPQAHSGRKTGNPDPELIIPVYLGKADNVRTRLQCYGRGGAHLENGNSNSHLNDHVQQRHALLSEAFSRGCSIVYRWAPTAEAEKTETRLLKTYDYAWNKGNNGVRRREEVLQKLDGSTSSDTQLLNLFRKLSGFHQKKTGVKVGTFKPLSLEEGSGTSSMYTNWESNNLLAQIFKFGRSQPRPVAPIFVFNDDLSNICGVVLGHGAVCIRPPVGGRKRCDEHKGMKVQGSTSKQPITDGKSLVSSFPICSLTLDDGSLCRKPPVQGRKRCEEHKGRKITGSLPSESVAKGKLLDYVYGPVLEAPKVHKPQGPVFSERSVTNTKLDTICGADLDNGTFCTERPVEGRKRCEEHKWKRANEPKLSSVFDSPIGNSTYQSVPYRSVVEEDYSSTCGATLVNGSNCRRPPAEGRKRCWQHEDSVFDSPFGNSTCQSVQYRSVVREDCSSTCGATLVNGSYCSRPPAEGGKRCWQHKGSVFDSPFGNSTCQSVPYRSVVREDCSSTCGATLVNGSYCRRPPAEGGKRCWQHKGMRSDTGSTYSLAYDTGEISSDICGAASGNGSICHRTPVRGRKRCEQHKGKRAAF